MRQFLNFIIFIVTSLLTNAQDSIKYKPLLNSRTESSYINQSHLGNEIITPSRTITFTTDEASYIDVDISPDGKTLLFTVLGDLYKVSSTGGVAKQLTRGLSINRKPLWSPDGKWIAFESDASGFVKLQVMDTSGHFNKIFGKDRLDLSNIKPIWFPDSEHLTVNGEVFHIAGIVSALPNNIENILQFSPDGICFYYLDQISRDSTAIISFDRISLSKSRITVLPKASSTLLNPSISPNTNWMIYWKMNNQRNADSLMAINLKTGNEKLITHVNSKFSGFIYNQQYSFSKDSKYLFIGYGGKIHKINIETGKNEIIPFTAEVNVDMGKLNYHEFNVSLDSLEVKYVRSVRPSPDGKNIIFSALNRIYVMSLLNGHLRKLAEQFINQFHPAYSHDGKWITYVSWSDRIGGHVWRIPSKGGKPEQMTKIPGLYLHPSWSSDGNQIVVAKGNNTLGRRDYPGSGQILVISVKDKKINTIADTVPLFNVPMFSPTNKRIIFQPNQKDANDRIWPKLVSVDLNGNNQNILATARKDWELISPIRQIILSPDAKYTVFMYNENLYLVPMANTGQPQELLDNKEPITLIRFARCAIDPNWEEGGRILSWVSTNQYCRIDPSKIIEEADRTTPNKTLAGLEDTKIIDVNVQPDQIIPIPLKRERLYGKGIIALINARLITMSSTKVIEQGTVIIQNGRFVNIGESQKVAIPPKAKVLDLKGKTIIPGLIDMHSHMYEAVPPDVFLEQSWQRILNFLYGVTTVRDPSGSFDTFGYSELVETGQMIGPRLFTVGNAVRPNYSLNSLHEANVIVENRKIMGATVIKQYTQPTRLQRQLLLSACEKQKLNMTNEAELDPLYFLGMVKDGTEGIEHNPVWGDVYKDVFTLLAKSGTYITPALQACYGREEGKKYFRKIYGQAFLDKNEKLLPDQYKSSIRNQINTHILDSGFIDQSKIDATIKHTGGRILMGSHGEDQGIGAHWEIWALHMGGLTTMEALETGTIAAAEGLGMQKDLGSIEVGKIADLIILDKNPLEDIHNSVSIRFVMKSGIIYDIDYFKRTLLSK